jgi:hypothetical protein
MRRQWKRLVCFVLGHKHKVTKYNLRAFFLAYLSPEGGTDGYCERCGYKWKNWEP